MHIGILTACYRPVVNGVTRMVALQEKYLAAAGHQVTVFTLGRPAVNDGAGNVIRSPGVPLARTGYHVAAGYSPVARRKLQAVDILHSHHLFMGLEFANRYGRGPVIFTNHTRYDLYLSSYSHLPRGLASQLMSFAWRRLTKFADVVVVPSATIGYLLRKSGVSVPIEVIENGVEVERFQCVLPQFSRGDLRIPDAAKLVSYVGRVAPEKNITRLMAEFKLAAQQCDDLYLLVIGGGPILKKVTRIVARYGLAGRVRFVGQVDPDHVPAYLAISDAFASASVSEVHPLTVIEALAAGLPVIAIDSPGMSDLVLNDRSGLLVSGSKGSLAWAMCAIASDDWLRSRLAAGAKTVGARYDIRNNIEQTLSLYRNLLGQDGERFTQVRATEGRLSKHRPKSLEDFVKATGTKYRPSGPSNHG